MKELQVTEHLKEKLQQLNEADEAFYKKPWFWFCVTIMIMCLNRPHIRMTFGNGNGNGCGSKNTSKNGKLEKE